MFVKKYLDCKVIGNRIYVDRAKLESLLSSDNRDSFPLDE